ncbi:hypothetical protein GCM10010106_50040 [Thermopolyspora flexuosa]|uniref:Uncharacterized protein n=2 Tax=Thermopolyspora flexuosa TaxID=103836 RepID=A0A543IXJ4_9ACTN|nr:hypothetical protein FHX40_2004 [Thermopolyspora flexuosa]GGM95280.1 hypothetical protein GCM10010106_50040 [Thermopolyspora flexuosa]
MTFGDMPSLLHDTINLIFRENPGLAVELLHDHLGADIPADQPVQVAPADLNDRPSRDMHPDTVLTIGPRQEPCHAIVLEVQQDLTAGKRNALPRYAAALWLRLDCPVTVLVVCPDRTVADGYRAPIRTTLPGYTHTPVVLGPDQIPVITDARQAATDLPLATLSVPAHGEHRRVVEAFVSAITHTPGDHATQYYEYAHAIVSAPVKRLLEEKMATSGTWIVSSPFAKEHFGRGLEQGRAEGEVKGEAKAVLAFLEARGISVSDDVRKRIDQCTDPEVLLTWARRAATATRAHDIFDD